MFNKVSSHEVAENEDKLLAAAGLPPRAKDQNSSPGSETYVKVGVLIVHKTYYVYIEAFQVKWTRVPDLVEKRKVFLKGGMAWVPSTEQSSIIFEEFQRNLEKALMVSPKDVIPQFRSSSSYLCS